MAVEYNPKAKNFGGSTATRGSADYHAHFSFRWDRKKRFDANVSYFEGAMKPEPGDPGPFTETIVAWLGQFFVDGQVISDAYAYFHYPMKKVRTLLPLPMRFPLRNNEVEIIGMVSNIRLDSDHQYEVFATRYGDDFTVGVNDEERLLTFGEFELNRDLLAFSSVARLFIEEKKK